MPVGGSAKGMKDHCKDAEEALSIESSKRAHYSRYVEGTQLEDNVSGVARR